MRLLTCPARALLAASALMCASSCATPAPTRISSPSAAIFTPEAKPVPSLSILRDNDGEALRQHQRDKDEWGQRGWDRLNAVCQWFEEQGVEGLSCRGD